MQAALDFPENVEVLYKLARSYYNTAMEEQDDEKTKGVGSWISALLIHSRPRERLRNRPQSDQSRSLSLWWPQVGRYQWESALLEAHTQAWSLERWVIISQQKKKLRMRSKSRTTSLPPRNALETMQRFSSLSGNGAIALPRLASLSGNCPAFILLLTHSKSSCFPPICHSSRVYIWRSLEVLSEIL